VSPCECKCSRKIPPTSPLALSLLYVCHSLTFSLYASSHIDDQVLEREKKKNRQVFTAISLLQMSPHITLSLSIPPNNETDTHTHTHTHTHIATGTAATSHVVSKVQCLSAPLNTYFYDHVAQWFMLVAQPGKAHSSTHLDIYTNTQTMIVTPTQRKVEMEPVVNSSGWSLPAELKAGAIDLV